jgi:hypothetical protein
MLVASYIFLTLVMVKKLRFIFILLLFATNMALAQHTLNMEFDKVPGFTSLTTNGKSYVVSSSQDYMLRYKNTKLYFAPISRLDFVSFTDLTLEAKKTSSNIPATIKPNFNPWYFTFNIGVGAQYFVKNSLHFGFNIDVIGFSVAGNSGFNYTNTENGNKENIQLKPSRLNLLLGNTNDIGTLNSQFFVGGNVWKKLWLKGGFSHTVFGFNGDALGSDYFKFNTMPLLSFAWHYDK